MFCFLNPSFLILSFSCQSSFLIFVMYQLVFPFSVNLISFLSFVSFSHFYSSLYHFSSQIFISSPSFLLFPILCVSSSAFFFALEKILSHHILPISWHLHCILKASMQLPFLSLQTGGSWYLQALFYPFDAVISMGLFGLSLLTFAFLNLFHFPSLFWSLSFCNPNESPDGKGEEVAVCVHWGARWEPAWLSLPTDKLGGRLQITKL